MAFHRVDSLMNRQISFVLEKLVTHVALKRLFFVCVYMSSHTIKSVEEILPALFTSKLLLHAVLF